jgi:hypothetical protein
LTAWTEDPESVNLVSYRSSFYLATHRLPSLSELDKIVAACPDSNPSALQLVLLDTFQQESDRDILRQSATCLGYFDPDKTCTWNSLLVQDYVLNYV